LSLQALIDALLEEADLIDELLEAAVEQRERVKDGDRLALQDLMKRIQDISFRVQAQEAGRARLVQSLAEELRCEPRFSALAAAFSAAGGGAASEGAVASDGGAAFVKDEKKLALFKGAGERLRHSVFALKSEMTVLRGLIEQNERFSAMLLSEWRRLDAGFMRSGGLDFRG
jgi:chemotaxis protein histidine kinase CheA